MLPCCQIEPFGSNETEPDTAVVYGTVAHPQGTTAYQAISPDLRREGPIGKIERIAQPGLPAGKEFSFRICGTGTEVDGKEYPFLAYAGNVVYYARYPKRKMFRVPHCHSEGVLKAAVKRLLAAGVTVVHAEQIEDRSGSCFVEVEDCRDFEALIAIAAPMVSVANDPMVGIRRSIGEHWASSFCRGVVQWVQLQSPPS